MKSSGINSGVMWVVIISIGFVIWSGLFIHRSSFITVDGQRSYSLFDDAMISMRYAWNFSHGHGLVWNQGEYVQGYTNFLMVLIMSLATLVFSKTTAVLFIQMFGVVIMLAIAYLNMKVAGFVFSFGHDRDKSLVLILAFLFGLLYYPLAYWSIMGMETGLLSMLLLAGVYLVFQYSRLQSTASLFLFSMIGGAAFLTRNDSLIYFFILWIYIYVEGFWRQNRRGSLYFASVFVYFVFIIGQLVFQYSYYSELLPNTYVLKMTGMPLLIRLQNGLGFTLPFLKETALLILLPILGLLSGFRREKLLLFFLFTASVLYQIYVGGDPWNYWRMMALSMPLLFLLCVDAALIMGRYVSSYWRTWEVPLNAGIISFFLFFCVISVNARFWTEISLQSKPYQTARYERNVNTAIVLNDILDKDATVGVFWAGAIPYYVGNPAIDFLGKSDRHVANLPPDLSGSVAFNGMNSVPGHNKYDLSYSIAMLKPTYVQRFFWGNQDVYPLVANDYVEVKYRYITLYLLKDSPAVNWVRLGIDKNK